MIQRAYSREAESSQGERVAPVRIGVGGWTYEDWRGNFYPEGLVQKRELEYASRRLSSIEINGTFYRTQKPESFERWRDETPSGFVFALKAPRYATQRRVLAEAGPSIERFVAGGLTRLGDRLGPINWQLPPTTRFDAADVAAFFELLPKSHDGLALRHAIEARHESFRTPEFVALAREHRVAIVLAADSKYPCIDDTAAPAGVGADFVYARIMGTREDEAAGYPAAALDAWAERARQWASGPAAREVFLYVISGFKARNPAAAMALIDRLGEARPPPPADRPGEPDPDGEDL
ncbi:MAG: DUF72 domain-containing protein [Limnobacter sp.]|nr:DUF72 domain-containing protein [Limnobacter sp.]